MQFIMPYVLTAADVTALDAATPLTFQVKFPSSVNGQYTVQATLEAVSAGVLSGNPVISGITALTATGFSIQWVTFSVSGPAANDLVKFHITVTPLSNPTI